MTARRLGWIVVALGLLFAAAAGEYSTWNWLALRRAARQEEARIAALQAEVDSLEREAVAVETDPQVQERLARERYGMLRRGEFGYFLEWDEPLDRGPSRR